MTDWHRAPAHTSDSQPVSSEGVKINIPIRKTSVQAVKSTVTQHEVRGSKQSFPLRTHIVVLMNLLKHNEWLAMSAAWRSTADEIQKVWTNRSIISNEYIYILWKASKTMLKMKGSMNLIFVFHFCWFPPLYFHNWHISVFSFDTSICFSVSLCKLAQEYFG